jgi:zinc protease
MPPISPTPHFCRPVGSRPALLTSCFSSRSVRSRLRSYSLASAFAGALLCSACGSGPGAAATGPGAANAAAQSAPTSPALPLDPRVLTGKLPNGFSYYLERHPSKEHRAQLVFVVKAGSQYEDEDQRGLAHFVEHMAFTATTHFAPLRLANFFAKSGMHFGPHQGARTLADRTEYPLSVPTEDPESLVTALDLVKDWATEIGFDPDLVKKERPVLLAEWDAVQSAGRQIAEQQRKILIEGSRAAEREVIGDKAILAGAPRERIMDFYRRWYRPERMALIVVGDIEPKDLEQSLRERFSSLTAVTPSAEKQSTDTDTDTPHAEAPPPSTAAPARRGPNAVVLTDPQLPVALVNVVFKTDMRPVRSEADYREQLSAMLSTLILSRRLDEISDHADAPFAGASSDFAPGAFGSLDLFQVTARTKPAEVQATLESLLLEIERVKRFGFEPAEIDATKAEYTHFLERMAAAEDAIPGMSIAAGLSNHFVVGNTVMSAQFQRELGTRILGEITPAALRSALLARLEASQELLLVSAPSHDGMPDRSTLLAALDTARAAPLEPYHEQAPRPLVSTPPTPGTIVKEETIAEIGVTVWKLSNGARVVLKPTDFKDDQILEQAVSFGGTARAEARDFPSARFAHDIVAASGVGDFDRQTLAKRLSGKTVQVVPWIEEQQEGIRGSAAPRDAETLFQLIYLYATAPREDAAAFEAYRGALRENVRQRDANPLQAFSDDIARKLWGDEPRRTAPSLASLDQMKLDVALRFYKDRFADLSDFVFVFVGKLDVPTLRPLAERYLASLPGKGAGQNGRKEKVHDLGLHRRKGISRVRLQQGPEGKGAVTFVYHGETAWSENAQNDLALLESYLGTRLREVLGERLTGAAPLYVGSSFERLPYDSYTFAISFECKPEDVEELHAAARGVIAELEKSGVDASHLEALKSARMKDLEEDQHDNEFWLERLTNKFKFGEDPRTLASAADLAQRITSDNVRLAARKFLRDDQYVDAILLPPSAANDRSGAVPSKASGAIGAARAR